MADDIQQKFSVDASQAIQAMDALNSAYKKHEDAILSLAATMQKFNGSSNAVTNAAASGARSLNSYAQSSKTLRGSFDDLISAHGKWTTSLQLASRIIYTQAVVIGFRKVRESIGDAISRAADFQKQLAAIRSIDSEKAFGGPDLGRQLRDLSTRNRRTAQLRAASRNEARRGRVATARRAQIATIAARISTSAVSVTPRP